MPRIKTFFACGPKEKCVPGKSIVHISHSIVISSALIKMGDNLCLDLGGATAEDLLCAIEVVDEDDDVA